MNRNGKLHALLATSRVANIPSVVSNVFAGIVIGLLADHTGQNTPGPTYLIGLPLAGVLLYVAGNFLNDWMDRSWDVQHRPERALPRGLFPSGLYLAASILLHLAGIGLACFVDQTSGIVAAAIAFWIVVYTLIHKRTAWGVIPMGLCRALLPVMGCVAFFPYVDKVWPAACALLVHIMGLSLAARHEAMKEPPKSVAIMSRILLLATALFAAWGAKLLWADRPSILAGVVPYLIWTSLCLRTWRKPVPLLVSRLLAGIPLVDWMILLPAGLLLRSGATGLPGIFALSCLALPPVAWICALLLQRLAPAT